ncbi:MAG TPA: thiamine phosphate synthase [Kofleriaceae bacterium]|jgi:thiamine-phosphate pyrophosphorylase|nr:thiamine phosphate synthase [Kofleriaceae bacterium]
MAADPSAPDRAAGSRRAVADHIRGFYAVLDRDDEALAQALVRGARVLQLRIKPIADDRGRADAVDLVRIARMARRVCAAAGAALIVNDRLDVALAADADGVHLGQTDLPIGDARRVLAAAGRTMWIGVSTHNVGQVRAACDAGADYLGFGPIFTTTTKQNPDPVQGLTGLTAAVAEARGCPIVAIGGVTADQAAALYATGAAAICAISAVNHAPDPAAAAVAFRR